MIYYDKIIRDKIPDIIEKDGKVVIFKKLDRKDSLEYLNKKLKEEVYEYLESNNIEELADIIEVIYAILYYRNLDIEYLEKIRIDKKEEKGGFEKGIKLISVSER